MRKLPAGVPASSPPSIGRTCLAAALALALAAGASAQAQQAQAQQAQAQQGQAQQGQAPAASGQVKPAAEGQASPAADRGNDFPTLARVEYVFECLGDNPDRPRHEMLYKCVCAVDRVAEAVSYDRWVELSTFFKAQPMAGERGAYVRERSDIRSQLKSYRDLQAKVKKACFIPSAK